VKKSVRHVLRVAAHWLFVLCFPLLLLSGTIGVAVNSLWVYTSGFTRHNVSSELGLSDAELKSFARELIRYFNDPDQQYFNSSVMNERGETAPLYSQYDTEHMKDVKWLVWLDYAVFLIVLLYVSLYCVGMCFWDRYHFLFEIGQGMLRGGLTTIASIGVLCFLALTSFERFFYSFHEVLFPRGGWYFSYGSKMTTMFPNGFWFDIVIGIGVVMLVFGSAIAIVGWKTRKHAILHSRIKEFKGI